MEEITKEINLYSYWEHFKAARDLALILPIGNPKREAIEACTQNLLDRLKRKEHGKS